MHFVFLLKKMNQLFKFVMLLFCLTSFGKEKEGKITFDLSPIKNQFDRVVITIRGIEELGDTLKIVDTLKVVEGKFVYHFSVSETKLASFDLLKNNEEVTTVGLRDATMSEVSPFWSEICIGNEDIKISYLYSEWRGSSPSVEALAEGIKENKWYQKFDTTFGTAVTLEFVKNYPNSFAILQSVYNQRGLFSSTELSDRMVLFAEELKQSATYNKLQKYRDKKILIEQGDFGKTFHWVDSNDNTYDFKAVLGSKKYVLLFFWSSDCQPCKNELNKLKKFQEQYSEQVNIVNMSTNTDLEQWKKTIAEEKMTGFNLSGIPNSKEGVKEVYRIDTLPEFLLLDSQGNSSIKEVVTELEEVDYFFKYPQKPAK